MSRPPLRSLVQVVVLVLLTACNGGDDGKTTDTSPTDTDTGTPNPTDLDNDGFAAPEDCDDANPARYPGAVEHCDGVDQNCVDDAEEGVITLMPSQSFTTLAEAAAAAVGGETVQVCPGTYAGTTTFTVPITIVGIAGADTTGSPVRPILDGGGGGTTLHLEGAGSRVEGLAITGGTRSGILAGLGADVELVDLEVYDNIGEYGGGIQFSPEGGTLEDSVVHDNIAQEDGGGVYGYGSITLSRVELSNNVAGNWGGGMTLGTAGSLDLADVTIADNTAERGGGLFAREDTVVSATGTTWIDGNSASASGGGVYLYRTDWTGGRISGNSAVDSGGGLYVYDGGSVVGLDIDGNTANTGGGAFVSGVLALESVQVLDNSANTDGGGLYLLDATASLDGTTVSGNDAPDGGGVYLQDSSLTGGTIAGNEADNGGGVFLYNVEATTTATLDGTRVEDNTATTSGGGVYITDDADLIDVYVLRNLSDDRAGGIYVTNAAEVSVSGGLVQSNTATQRGGGLYTNTDAAVELDGTELSRNQALRGAGIYVNNDSSVELTDCAILQNGDPTTVSGGGARVITGDLVSITSDWGEGPDDNTPDDIYTEQLGSYVGYAANSTFACDPYGCSPEP